MKKLWPVFLLAVMLAIHPQADAKRMGSGKSVGQQSSNVTQRQATSTGTPGASGTPTQSTGNTTAAKPATAPNAAPAAPAPAPKKPWGAMLGGLAAGLGLAWLAHSLGMGQGFGQILMFLLLGLAAFVAFKMVMRARQNTQTAPDNASPFAFQGAGAGSAAPAPATAPVPPGYSLDKVGNDASARPWERHSTFPDSLPSASGSSAVAGSALTGSQNWGIPEGFDSVGFIEAAKRNFTTLQAAWDRSDVTTLRSMMTDNMLGEIRTQLAERETHRGTQPNQTDVVMLEAQLLGIEDLGEAYMASVEFSGMIREETSVGPSPFREVWNMTKPKSGHSGWLVAGVQALQ